MGVQNLARVLLDAALDSGLAEAVAIREPKRVWTYIKLAAEAGPVQVLLRFGRTF